MSAAVKLTRRVLDEEIERHGQYSEGEGRWYVVVGEGDDGPVDQVTPVFKAAAARTGVAVERLRQIFRPYPALGQRGGALWGGPRR